MVKKTLIGLMAASTATLALVTPASAAEVSWSLTPRVEPGGRVDADTHAAILGCGPATPVTSDGFAAPLQWTEGGNYGRAGGHTTAIMKPGRYTAKFTCSDGRVATGSFVILGTPMPSRTAKPKPPTSRPATPNPAKPQVAVKPAGAPQTGDGSLD
jgi:hypothetical protein